MSRYTLEIAAFTLQGALTASKAGADRIELCENPADGGTTPSYGMLGIARDKLKLPVFPMIRSRGGDFVYSEDEIDAMARDIELCKKLGYEGVVFGLLEASGRVDITNMKNLCALASPMQVTMHRAFDRSHDAFQAMEDCIACGCHRILSSGHFPMVTEGLSEVKSLVEKSAGRILIMPGSGINSRNIAEIAGCTGATEFHTAARIAVHRENVYSPASMQETLRYIDVNAEEVRAIRGILDSIS